MTPEQAEKHTVLRVLTGSQSYGTCLDPTNSDRDEKGCILEPFEERAGFSQFEQYEFRTAAQREGKHDARSLPGDLDLTLYGLAKFLSLALKGNPSVVEVLFNTNYVHVTEVGRQVQALYPAIVSKRAVSAFLGFMQAQRHRLFTPMLERLCGDTWIPKPEFEWLYPLAQKYGWELTPRGGKDVNRPELVEKYGFDTKYAMHVVRLGFQGIELLQTGRLSLPLPSVQKDYCLAVRAGRHPLHSVLDKAGQLELELKASLSGSKLPDAPDQVRVEGWLLETYRQSWKL